MNRPDSPGNLHEQLYESEAWQTHLRLRHLMTNFRVFQLNYSDLKRLLHEIASSEQFDFVWNFVDTANLERVLLEITRQVHNLLASAKTLVDHTRRLVNDAYQGTEFMAEYQREIDARFTSNRLSQFIEGLRNYALHYSLPFPHAEMQYRTDVATGEATLSKTFVLETSTLLKWDGWQKGKDYLATVGPQIDLENLVDGYHNDIVSFHSWLHDKLKEIHATDLAWVDDMAKRINQSIGQIDACGGETTRAPQADSPEPAA